MWKTYSSLSAVSLLCCLSMITYHIYIVYTYYIHIRRFNMKNIIFLKWVFLVALKLSFGGNFVISILSHHFWDKSIQFEFRWFKNKIYLYYIFGLLLWEILYNETFLNYNYLMTDSEFECRKQTASELFFVSVKCIKIKLSSCCS